MSEILKGIGYKPSAQVLSVPVTYSSLKAKKIDVLLGNWMPSMEAEIKPYAADGSVETLGANLEGAKYTLAVPDYVAEAGVKTFADLAKNADKFSKKIYGIEPGNDGNRLILDMIKKNAFGLGGFKIVESSEAGAAPDPTTWRTAAGRKWEGGVEGGGRKGPTLHFETPRPYGI
jgi:glycine betaine/proline transport system substrate-binding protein